MPQAWNDKRERQYQHIKEGTEQRGSREKRAEEIAARTVNKDRARSGESQQASKTSTQDVSPEHRGGKRSGNRRVVRPKTSSMRTPNVRGSQAVRT
ncbi:hypothetical protein HDA37_000543 [Pseudonocardia antarctica]|uniref:Plasmid stabilization protein n=1 Tax=Pseudonocardia alni TaxID=33907 RepID=A0A852VTE4_PSEA5|nr:hypothetical protein [Pseudonocardia antarctica]